MQVASLIAPFALSKAIPAPTHTWDANRFANEIITPEEEEEFLGDEVDYVEEEDPLELEFASSFYTGVPVYDENYGYDFDPRLRRVAPADEGGVSQEAVPVLDTVVSPVENLSNRLPMPTVASPVESLNVGRPVGADPHGEEGGMDPLSLDATCCGSYIGHHELRQTRENLGLNQAQRARYGRSPGEGEALQPDDERVSGTQQTQHGPVPISDPLYTADLYDQGFVSLSAVPSVFVGVYTDPITGEEFDAYESGMPPPDADYEEMFSAPARNVSLARLQGGWRDTTPRPTKVEVLEDDFHMQYDRSINTYGTYDPTYYMEVIEHNNRFKRDGHHPDSEGPIQVGTPANTLGNQGDVKVRFTPYVTPTNRGKWAETTFRSGIDASQEGAGGGDLRMEYEYTTNPYIRAESNRIDGGGMEAGGAYQGFMNQYGGSEGFDHHPTQRSTSEHRMPNMGPAGDGGAQALGVYGEVAAPTGNNGTQDVGLYGVGNLTGEQEGAMLQNQMVPAPHSLAGLEAVEELAFGPAQYEHEGQKLMNQKVENVNSKSGVVNAHLTRGVRGETGHGQQLDGGVRTAMDKTKREALLRVQATMDGFMGGYHAAPNQATRTRFSDKSGYLVDFMMPSGTLGGSDSLVANGSQVVGESTNLDTKREAFYDNQFGVDGVAATAPDATVWYGNYRQGMEHLSVRPRGSVFENTNAGAGMALGFREMRDTVGR
jgi:ribosomal protein L35AE/L33A